MISILAAVIAVYFLLPRMPPQGEVSRTVAFAAAMFVAWLAFGVRAPRRLMIGCALAIVMLAGARVATTAVGSQEGWLARYYANESWSGTPEWSSDFRRADATRIDRVLSFENNEFPTYYLNGAAFGQGSRREVSEPMSVAWSGFVDMAAAGTAHVAVSARGSAVVTVDGKEVLAVPVSGANDAEATVALDAGPHEINVKYLKPAGVDGLLRVSTRAGQSGRALAVTPEAVRRGMAVDTLRWLSHVPDGLVMILLLTITGVVLRALWTDQARRTWLLISLTVFVLFGVQGYWRASTQFQTLTGGDDWLGFESRARDLLQNGPLMTLGQPIGQGVAYFFHPFYSYFLAAAHAISGESLFGPVFFQFLILAATSVAVWSMTRPVFGSRPALAGLAALLVLFEWDFARHYTVILLSENLYILTVTLTLGAFMRWAQNGERSALWATGLFAGLSSVTRPAMMMFFVPALAVAALIAWRRHARVQRTIAAVAVLAVAWMAVIAPFTLRNWVVARKLVLISDGQGGAFILHNLPRATDAALYESRYTGGIVSGLAVMARIALDQPAAFAALQLKKLGFTLGMVHWHPDYRPHPELVAITALYLAMCVFSRTMRSPPLWPVHAFVVAHVASMGLTSPWNYGYRMILPPFVYMAPFAVAAAAAALSRRGVALQRSEAAAWP